MKVKDGKLDISTEVRVNKNSKGDYYFNTGYSVPIVPTRHRNSSRKDSPVFSPTQHSLKQECKEIVSASNAAPRILAESLDEHISILERTTEAGHARNAKQYSCEI